MDSQTNADTAINRRFFLYPLLTLFTLYPHLNAHAQTGGYSGTGFFVDKEAHVVTNYHVVQDCSDIFIGGPVPFSPARLVGYDEDNDLALLRTARQPTDIAYLRSSYYPTTAYEMVLTVGFPRNYGLTTREANVISTTGPSGEDTLLTFTDTVDLGNSGGPLLDRDVNVVGVVMAKANIFKMRYSDDETRQSEKADVAIQLPILRDFLDEHDVRYKEKISSGLLSASRVEERASDFIVQVRCR